MPWPPQVEDVKADLGLAPSDTRDDANLQVVLDAAVAWVEEQRLGDYNFAGATAGDEAALPVPTAAVVLGTIRLAVREHSLRRSPTGLIDSGEFGTVRVPRVGDDIHRLLGTGPYRRPLVG